MSLAKTILHNISLSYKKLTTLEKNSFRYWRVRIMYASILGYAAFYLVRQNFSMAMPGIMEEFNYSKVELGWIVTIWSIVYGAGKFINGYLSDRSDARYFMAIGLFGSAIVSLLMGFGGGLVFLGALWAVNGWFQSMGWPPAARLITQWFSPKELGTKWAFWASSHQIGGATIVILAGFLIAHYGWRSAFYVPAFLALGFSFFLFNRLRDTPRSVGLPDVEEYKGDVRSLDPLENERITIREVIPMVLGNKLVWFAGLANMCLYVPRMGVFVWAPTFLKEFKGVSIVIAGGQLAAFEIAGLFGGIAAGWISDKIFESRRGPVGALFLLALAGAMFLLWVIPAGHAFLDTFILMIAGFLVYGPQVLAGLAAADFASKRAVGVATGLAGTLAYIGSAVSGVGIGYIVETWGWDGGFFLFMATSLLGAFFFALTWRHRAKILDSGTKEGEPLDATDPKLEPAKGV